MPVSIWRSHQIPYVFHENIDKDIQKTVLSAMDEIKQCTECISFVPRKAAIDYLFITEGERCFSDVGRIGGKQDLFLDRNHLERPVVLHELCHAIGLYHEYQRSIRDYHIKVHFENIEEEHRIHFIKITSEDDLAEFDFDFDSIMLYGASSFANEGSDSVTSLKGEMCLSEIEKKIQGLSYGDIRKLKYLYRKSQTKDDTPSDSVNTDTNSEKIDEDEPESNLSTTEQEEGLDSDVEQKTLSLEETKLNQESKDNDS